MKEYQAGGAAYFYPEIGDPPPSRGAKVIILTEGGIATTGPFVHGSTIGWAYLPRRKQAVEDEIRAKRQRARTEKLATKTSGDPS